MKVLIAGATGQTGRLIAKELAERGHDPVAMVREGSDLSVLPDGVETRQGDLADLSPAIVNGMDAVVFAAGSGGDTSQEMTRKIDRDGAKALIDIAASGDPARFVMLSTVGADAPSAGPDEMQHYLEAKRDADEHLKASGLPYAIVRPVSLTNDQGAGAIELSNSVEGEEISRQDVANVLAKVTTGFVDSAQQFEIAKGSVPIDQALANA